jgi:hypothetical protein
MKRHPKLGQSKEVAPQKSTSQREKGLASF